LRRLLDFRRDRGLGVLGGLIGCSLRLFWNSALLYGLHRYGARGAGDIAHSGGEESERASDRGRGQPQQQQEGGRPSDESVEWSVRLRERRRGTRSHPAADEEGNEEA
jgi:hypothetical protein